MRISSLLPRSINSLPFLIILVSAMLLSRSAEAQTSLQIHDIMTNLPNSPYLGQSVSVSGIIVGVMNTGGFYISEPSASWDSLVSTAEGMPVFYASAALNPACAVVGNIVTVVGTVANTTALTAANTPGTGITPTSCTVTGTGTMTQSISLSSVLTSFGDALKYTGMAASNTSFYAVAPTGGTLTEASETVTSNGQFWATLSSNAATNNHLFRSAGIAGDEYKPSTAPTTVTTWGGNPQRILIDTATFGGTPVDITVGQAITCSVPSGITLGATTGIGLIDYTLGYSRLLIFKSTVCTVSGTVAATTSAAADSTHFHVGTLDLNRFYNTTSNTSGAVAITATAYATRLAKAANAIVNSLGKPDILSLQEVKDLATITDLASAVNTLGGTSYVPYLVVGNDTASLNLGFLINSGTVVTDSVTQVEASDTYTTASGGSATLWERPPLVLKAEFVRVGKNYPVTVINVHLTSRDNIGDTALGPDVRAHRAAQAADLSSLVQSYQTAGDNVLIAGNFNAFQFSDGYVDVLGVVTGSPAAASAVTLYQASNTTAPLTNFATSVTATSRYNYLDRGNAESIEHILASATVSDSSTASASLASYVSAVTQPHFSADFAAVEANSSTTAAGLTAHDGFVVAFLIPPVPTTASISSSAINFGNVYVGGSASQTVTITNTTSFTSTVNVTNIAISGTNSGDFSQTSNCTSLAEGASCTITLTFAPTATGTRTGLLTVTTDSTSNPSLTATLTGTGLPTTATISSTSLSYANTIVGSTSAAQNITWSNTSAIPLSITKISTTGDFAASATTCTGTAAANASCTVSVVFTPTVLGTRTGTVSIVSTSSENGTLTATLSRRGVADVEASVSTLGFGNVDIGHSSVPQTFTVTNYTASSITLTSVLISGDYAYTSTCGPSIPGLSTCAVTVTFTPTVVGARTGALTINTNDTKYPVIVVALAGNGVDFSISISPTSGQTVAGYQVSPSLTLTPLGGFSAPIVLTCTTTATGSSCTPSSTALTLSAVSVMAVAITTTSQYTVIGYSGFGASNHPWLTLFAFLTAGGLLLNLRRGRMLPRMTSVFALLVLISFANLGCGSKNPNKNANPTYPGTYTYTISATDGTLTHTASYSLTVTVQ